MVTGLNLLVSEKLLKYLCKGAKEDSRTTTSALEEQSLLTIVELKHNTNFDLLSYIYNIAKSTSIDHFWKWIDIMYKKLIFLIKMQDRDHIYQTTPCF